MATQRYISTSFWDDAWVQELDPTEKLFYIYLLTNPLTNIAGVYQITDRRISFDLGFSSEVVKEMWRRFKTPGKVIRNGEWVVIPSWPKHQKWESRSKVRDGIVSILQELPGDVLDCLEDSDYKFDLSLVDSTIIARKARTGMSGSTRKRVLEAAEGRCQRCGKPTDSLEVHHIVPLKDGGDNSFSNLQAVCIPCHKGEHNPHTISGPSPHRVNRLETQSSSVHNYSDSDSDSDPDSDSDSDSDLDLDSDLDSDTDTDSDASVCASEDQSQSFVEDPDDPFNDIEAPPKAARYKHTDKDLDKIIAYANSLEAFPPERRLIVNFANAGQILDAASLYSKAEIKQALDNYATCIRAPDTYRVTPFRSIENFIVNQGVAKYLDSAKPLERYVHQKGSRETEEERLRKITEEAHQREKELEAEEKGKSA